MGYPPNFNGPDRFNPWPKLKGDIKLHGGWNGDRDTLPINGKAISVEIPQTLIYEVVETPPNFKGDSQGGKKPAKLESGATVQVPFFVLEGDRIKVDTSEGKYLEKAK